MFTKVLIANRGEIAVRVMRACKELDIDTVTIYSEADKNSPHVEYADEAYNVGPARAADSYLDQEAVLDAAERAGAEAIHPGYGFMAENPAFAATVEDHEDVTWIGPSAHAMEQMGTKTAARRVMRDADVPIVPGTTEELTGPEDVVAFADEHGYPVAIKASAGGGGRGMKIVRSTEDVEDKLESARREGEAYFDDDSVYLERYLENPRHVEVQIIADHAGNVRHLGERDCSLQRRHQKLLEEGPSHALSDDLRSEILAAARRGMESVEYTNAGTVEFLVADDPDREPGERLDAETDFYFLEVNTRIQVEHTVTEEITGIDIVKWQLRVAAGEELSFRQDDIDFSGHAMEFRINAEGPAEDFAPVSGGRISTYDPPAGIGVRLDDAIRTGDDLVTDYDSMIGKLIVSAGNREECIARSKRALAEFDLEGIATIVPFHRLMLEDDQFVGGLHSTSYVDEEVNQSRLKDAREQWGEAASAASGDSTAVQEREFVVEVDGKRLEVNLEERGAPPRAGAAEMPAPAKTQAAGAGSGDEDDESGADSAVAAAGERITAEMQGTVLDIPVSEGDTVGTGDVLCVLEAMKMENDIVSPRPGTITSTPVEEGESVDMGDLLFVID